MLFVSMKLITDSLFSSSFSHCLILPLISSFFRIFARRFCELTLGKFQCTLSEFVRKSNRIFKSPTTWQVYKEDKITHCKVPWMSVPQNSELTKKDDTIKYLGTSSQKWINQSMISQKVNLGLLNSSFY